MSQSRHQNWIYNLRRPVYRSLLRRLAGLTYDSAQLGTNIISLTVVKTHSHHGHACNFTNSWRYELHTVEQHAILNAMECANEGCASLLSSNRNLMKLGSIICIFLLVFDQVANLAIAVTKWLSGEIAPFSVLHSVQRSIQCPVQLECPTCFAVSSVPCSILIVVNSVQCSLKHLQCLVQHPAFSAAF